MSNRPVIAVTGPSRGGFMPWLMTWLAVTRCGGKAVRLHPRNHSGERAFDGLILGGGTDISPEHYGEELAQLSADKGRPPLGERLLNLVIFLFRLLFSIKFRQPQQDAERDTMEKSLCREAVSKQLPILGICRGAQMINVCLGGSLHQDTRDFYTETPHLHSIRPIKPITLEGHSKLAKILARDELRVNALHNQAVNTLGDNLVVSARDANGIVQAIAHRSAPFIIGVQWHPEYLPRQPSQRRLFAELVRAAGK